MIRGEGACLVCGEPLIYKEKAEEMECIFCHKKVMSHAMCKDKHFVCDECHAQKGIEVIMTYCMESESKNPIAMLQEMMEDPYIYMHGPEHHIMVGAALLTAYKNAGGELDLTEALEEMKERGSRYPGGSCGFWGCCGAAVSAGMAMSILTGTTPLSGRNWGLSNQMTAGALAAIGALGGPRCCKRNSFTATKAAVSFLNQHFHMDIEESDEILCDHSHENQQCIQKACPYYRRKV